MSTKPYIQASFNAGELSPRLLGRVDLDKYFSGCKTMENAIAQKWGPATMRPGTKYAGNAVSTRASQFANRLIPFQYNTEQSYVLALESDASGNLIRFFKDEGLHAVADPGVTITNGTFDSDITGWTVSASGVAHDGGLFGNTMVIADTKTAYQDVSSWPADTNEYAIRFKVGTTTVSNLESDIYNHSITITISTNSGGTVLKQAVVGVGTHVIGWTHNSETTVRFHFQNSSATGTGSLTLDNVVLCANGAIEVEHPWDGEDECRKLSFTQSADVLFFGHLDFRPYNLLRLDDNAWSLEPYPHENGPWMPQNDTAITMTAASATGQSVAVTASSATFVAADVGRLIAIDDTGSAWGWGVIVGVTSTTVAEVNVQLTFGGTSGTAKWRLGAWGTAGDRSDYDHNPEPSWPWHPTFHAQRIWWGGATSQPQTMWSSVVGDFFDFTPYAAAGTVRDDDGLTYTIDSDQVNAIRWLKSVSRGLLIGTSGGEFVATGGGTNDPITPTTLAVRRQSAFGSKEYVEAQLVGQSVLFAQATGRKIRQIQYSFEADQYVGTDLTLLAEHITQAFTETDLTENVIATAYQQEPNSALWCVRADGQILHLTLEQEQDIYAWSRIVMAGPGEANPGFGLPYEENGIVESVAVVRYQGRDQVWVAVRRYVNSATVCHVEVFQPEFGPDHELVYTASLGSTTTAPAAWFLDGAVAKYDAGAFTTVTGLEHWEGQSLTALVFEGSDSSVQVFTGLTVSSGSVTIASCTSAVVGKAYDTTIETMPILPERQPAMMFGKHRVNRVAVQVDRSSEGKVEGTPGDTESMELGRVALSGGLGVYTIGKGLFTGAKEFPVASSVDEELIPTIKITQDTPLPFTLLALRAEVDVGGI